jgi:hypothetical protein
MFHESVVSPFGGEGEEKVIMLSCSHSLCTSSTKHGVCLHLILEEDREDKVMR